MNSPQELTELGLDSDSKVDFRAYWRTIRKRWPFVVLSMIVATVIAFVYTYRQPKIYEATCQVIIEPMAPQVLPGSKDVVELGTGTFWANKEFYETQYRIIQSTNVGQRTAEKLGLQYDPDYAGVGGTEPRSRRAWAASSPGRSAIKPLKDSRLALITVSDRKPQRAACIANTIADTYIELQPRLQARGGALGDGLAGRAGGGPQAPAGGVGAEALPVQEGSQPAGGQPRRQAEHAERRTWPT